MAKPQDANIISCPGGEKNIYKVGIRKKILKGPQKKSREAELDLSCKDRLSSHPYQPGTSLCTTENLGLELREHGAPGRIWGILSPSWPS